MTEYILFVAECANFCPRTALIPANEFIQARKDDYEIMKQCAVQYNGFSQVLFQNYIWTGSMGVADVQPWDLIVGDIITYIEAYDRENYGEEKDRAWIDGMITDLSSFQFNAQKIMKNLQSKTFSMDDGRDITISESFLVLEKENGKLKPTPMYDTVDELLLDYFSAGE